ncbi:MAG: orotate phosphoribosyltransferase, partial [Bacteroidia bacterium]|nr:orotate phosphoribosyltransferase [Bacteroidia bacterium]
LYPNQKVTILEDLISTGGSSLKAVQAVQATGGNVLGILSIFTYGFLQSENIFKKNLVHYESLCNLEQLLTVATNRGIFSEQELKSIAKWQQNPSEWNSK